MANPADRRQFGRRPVFKVGTIAQANGQRVPVAVIDMSEGGARIKVAKPDVIESEFYLEIPEDDFIVKCEVMRREEAAIGVRFTRSPRRLSWLVKRQR